MQERLKTWHCFWSGVCGLAVVHIVYDPSGHEYVFTSWFTLKAQGNETLRSWAHGLFGYPTRATTCRSPKKHKKDTIIMDNRALSCFPCNDYWMPRTGITTYEQKACIIGARVRNVQVMYGLFGSPTRRTTFGSPRKTEKRSCTVNNRALALSMQRLMNATNRTHDIRARTPTQTASSNEPSCS